MALCWRLYCIKLVLVLVLVALLFCIVLHGVALVLVLYYSGIGICFGGDVALCSIVWCCVGTGVLSYWCWRVYWS